MGNLFPYSGHKIHKKPPQQIKNKKSRKSVMKHCFDQDSDFFKFTNYIKEVDNRKNFKLTNQVLKNFEFVLMKSSKNFHKNH